MFDECGAGYLHSAAAEREGWIDKGGCTQLNEINTISMFDL